MNWIAKIMYGKMIKPCRVQCWRCKKVITGRTMVQCRANFEQHFKGSNCKKENDNTNN